MLKFNNFPPEKAGDVEICDGIKRDLEIAHDGGHLLFGSKPTETVTLLGIAAGYGVYESRAQAEATELTPDETVDIIKPVVDQVAEITNGDRAISFARGVMHSLHISFPEYHKAACLTGSREHQLFQELISGVSEEEQLIA